MYTRRQISGARKFARAQGVRSLLSALGSNPKTTKNSKDRLLTVPLHLAPSNLSGYQVCPAASKGCIAACLHTAGNPAYQDAKDTARIARTRLFFEHRDVFLTLLYAELASHQKRARKARMRAGVRLNATSDIAWERIRFPNGKTVIEAFRYIRFYDYTKRAKRMRQFLDGEFPKNYYLTFSAAENNHSEVFDVLNAGGVVAVAVNVKRGQPIPDKLHGRPTIDADTSDNRPSDPAGHFAVLRAKGQAIGDTSGFVWPISEFRSS